LFFTVIFIYVSFEFSRTVVIKKILDKIVYEKLRKYKIEYSDLEINLLPLGVSLRDVSLRSKINKIFELKKVVLKLSMKSLFLGEIRFRELAVHRGYIHLLESSHRNTKKTSTVPRNHSWQWPPDIPNLIRHITLDEIDFSYRSPSSELTVEDLTMKVDLFDWKDFKGIVNFFNGSLKINNRKIFQKAKWISRFKFENNNLQLHVRLNSLYQQIQADQNIRLFMKRASRELKRIEWIGKMHGYGLLSLLEMPLDLTDRTEGRVYFKGKNNGHYSFNKKIPNDFNLNLKVNVKNGWLDGFRLYDLKTELVVNLNQIIFNNIVVNINNKEKLFGIGEIKFNEESSYFFNIKMDSMNLSEILGVFDLENPGFTVNLDSEELVLSGVGEPAFHMDVLGTTQLYNTNIVNSRFDREFAEISCQIDLSLTVDEDSLRIDPSNLGYCLKNRKKPHIKNPLNVTGVFFFDKKQGIDVQIDLPKLSPFLQNSEGFIHGNIRFIGSYEEIVSEFMLKATNFSLEGLRVPFLKTYFKIKDHRLSWKHTHLIIGEKGELKSPFGELTLKPPYNITSKFSIKQFSVETLSNVLKTFGMNPSIGFFIHTLEGDIKGSLIKPFQWVGKIAGEISQRETEKPLPFFEKIRFSISANSKSYQIEPATFWLKSHRIDVSFLARRRPFKRFFAPNSFWKTLENLGLNHDDQLTLGIFIDKRRKKSRKIYYLDHLLHQLRLEAGVYGKAYFTGTFGDITGVSDFQITDLNYSGMKTGDFYVKSVHKNFRINSEWGDKKKHIRAKAFFDFHKPQIPYVLDIALKHYQFNQPDILFEKDTLKFDLSASFKLQGTIKNWWESTAQILIDNWGLTYQFPPKFNHYSLVSSLDDTPINIDISENIFNTHQKKISFNGKYINSFFKISRFSLKNDLDFQLDHKLDLSLLKDLTKQVELSQGSLIISQRVRGSLTNLLSTMTFENDRHRAINIALSSMRPVFHDIQLSGQMNQNKVMIEEISIKKGNGSIRLTGQFDFEDSSNINNKILIDLNKANFNFSIPMLENLSTELSGSLVLSLNTQPFELGGEIKIDNAISYSFTDLFQEKQDFQSTSSMPIVSQKREKPLLYFNDVLIQADKSIRIINNSLKLDATMSANLRLNNDDNDPNFLGELNVDRGEFFFRRLFMIKEGRVLFDDIRQINPRLYFSSEANVDSYIILFSIIGQLPDPEIRFDIEPSIRSDGSVIDIFDIATLLRKGYFPATHKKDLVLKGLATDALNMIIGGGVKIMPFSTKFDDTWMTGLSQVYLDFVPSRETGVPLPRLNLPINLAKKLSIILQANTNKEFRTLIQYPIAEEVLFNASMESSSQEKTHNVSGGINFHFGIP